MIKQKAKSNIVAYIIIGVIMIAALGMIAVVFSDAFDNVMGELIDSGEFSNTTTDTMTQVRGQTVTLMDFFIFFLLITSIIGMFIFAFKSDFHPVIVIGLIIGLLIAVFMASQMANAYGTLIDVEEVADTASSFTKTNLILGQAFPIIILISVVIAIIIMFGKSRRVAEV